MVNRKIHHHLQHKHHHNDENAHYYCNLDHIYDYWAVVHLLTLMANSCNI